MAFLEIHGCKSKGYISLDQIPGGDLATVDLPIMKIPSVSKHWKCLQTLGNQAMLTFQQKKQSWPCLSNCNYLCRARTCKQNKQCNNIPWILCSKLESKYSLIISLLSFLSTIPTHLHIHRLATANQLRKFFIIQLRPLSSA